MSAEPTSVRQRPLHQSVAFAVATPIILIVTSAMARVMWPDGLGSWVRLETLGIVALAGYVLGTVALGRALRVAKARWVVALVAYDLAMPVAIVGLLFILEASHRGFK